MGVAPAAECVDGRLSVVVRGSNVRLFASYARADAAAVAPAVVALRAAGHDIWRDVDRIAIGDEFPELIRRYLISSDGLLVFLSRESVSHPWVMMELGAAWALGIPLFPVAIEDVPQEVLPAPLRNVAYCDLEDVSRALLQQLNDIDRGARQDTVPMDEITRKEAIARSLGGFGHHPRGQRSQVALLVLEALSSNRDTRRAAHTAMRQVQSTSRAMAFHAFTDLLAATDPHVRGESIYCLGFLPANAAERTLSEEFVREFLDDEEHTFVQACCANVLSTMIPLAAKTRDLLQDLVAVHSIRIESDRYATKFLYYAAMTLNR